MSCKYLVAAALERGCGSLRSYSGRPPREQRSTVAALATCATLVKHTHLDSPKIMV